MIVGINRANIYCLKCMLFCGCCFFILFVYCNAPIANFWTSRFQIIQASDMIINLYKTRIIS